MSTVDVDPVLAEAAQARSIAAPALWRDRISQGWRFIMAGAAAAMVLLALGIAIRLALGGLVADNPPALPPVAAPTPPQEAPGRAALPDTIALPADREDIVVRDYVIFTETERMIDGVEFSVIAGHRFETERDIMYTAAWCYSPSWIDGVEMRLTLGNLNPGEAPVPAAPSASAEVMGLSPADVRTLFESCPWLEKRETAVPGAATYHFEGEVTKESVGRLLAAVAEGAKEITLHSDGGDLAAALRGFDAMHAAGVSTRAVGPCASACVILFAAGRERQVDAGGTIAIHQWTTEKGVDEAEAQVMSAEIVERFERAGISPRLFVAASRVPHDQIARVSRAELAAWGVITRG